MLARFDTLKPGVSLPRLGLSGGMPLIRRFLPAVPAGFLLAAHIAQARGPVTC